MLQFITAAESLFVSVHRDNQRLQMMALSGATPLKLRVDVAGILSSVPGLCFVRVLMGNSDVSHIIFAQLGGPKLVRSFVRTDKATFVCSFVRSCTFVRTAGWLRFCILAAGARAGRPVDAAQRPLHEKNEQIPLSFTLMA